MDYIYGLLISIILYGFISITYLVLGEAWALSPYLVIPFFMIITPFGIHLGMENNKNLKQDLVSNSLLISIVLTSLIAGLFLEFFFDVFNHLGVKKIY